MTKTDYMLTSYLSSYFGAVDVAKLEREHEYHSFYGYPNASGTFVHRYKGAPVWSSIESSPMYDFNQRKFIEHDFCLAFSTKRTLFYRVLGKLGYNHRSFVLRVNLITFITFCSSLENISVDLKNLIRKDENPVRVGKYLYNIESPKMETQRNFIGYLNGKEMAPINFLVVKGVLSKRSIFHQLVFVATRIILFGIVLKGVWDFVTFLHEIIFPVKDK